MRLIYAALILAVAITDCDDKKDVIGCSSEMTQSAFMYLLKNLLMKDSLNRSTNTLTSLIRPNEAPWTRSNWSSLKSLQPQVIRSKQTCLFTNLSA